MKITIVTPSYQQADYLEETLLSVLQTSVELEYIVIDGGSSDGSVDIIRKYDHQLAYWISEPDSGQTEAINKGIRRATGDVIAYLNSDDLYLPGTLETIAELFLAKPEVMWIAGAVENFYSKQEVRIISPAYHGRVAALGRYQYSLHQPGIFWRRELTDKIGYFDEELNYCFDHEYWMRAIFAGFEPLCINATLARFRLHRDSKTCSLRHHFLPEDRTIAHRYCDSLSSNERKQALEYLDLYEASYFSECAYGILKDQGRAAALRYLHQSRRLIPKLHSKKLFLGALARILTTGSPPVWFMEQK